MAERIKKIGKNSKMCKKGENLQQQKYDTETDLAKKYNQFFISD